MITKQVIEALYRKYSKRPDSPDELNLGLIFDYLIDTHQVMLDEEFLYINSLDAGTPFHRIPLRNIHEIVEFADDVAIVLHSSIIILSKHGPKVSVHIRPVSRSLSDLFRRVSV